MISNPEERALKKVIESVINHVREKGLALYYSFSEEIDLCNLIKNWPISKMGDEALKRLNKKSSTSEIEREEYIKTFFNPRIADEPTQQIDFNDSAAITKLANDCRSLGLLYLITIGDENISWDRKVKLIIRLDSKSTQLMQVGNRLIGYHHQQTLKHKMLGQKSVSRSKKKAKADNNFEIIENLYRKRGGNTLRFRVEAMRATGRGERTITNAIKKIQEGDAEAAILANILKKKKRSK